MDNILFDFECDGERHDLECATKEAAAEWADNWFAEKWADEGLRNGETREDEGEIIGYRYDDETGEKVEVSREKYALEYEAYHGDYAEHNTHWGL